MLLGQSMLDAFECFLNAPAGVVQITKVRGGIVDGVEQGLPPDREPCKDALARRVAQLVEYVWDSLGVAFTIAKASGEAYQEIVAAITPDIQP